jgi:hypothetical protein
MLDTAIPAPILSLGQQLCRDLTALAWRQVDAPLQDLEDGVLDILRPLAAAALTLILSMSRRRLRPGRRPLPGDCPQCGRAAPAQNARQRTVRTRCGTVGYTRPWHHCVACRAGFSPVDATLGIPAGQRISSGLAAQITALGTATTFREAAELLQLLTGQAVHAETVRRITEAAGAALVAEERAAALVVETTQEPAQPVAPAPGALVVETDGVMERYQDGWHEEKVKLAGGWVNGELQATSYTAARLDAGRFGPLLLSLAAHRGALETVGWTGGIRQRGLATLRSVVVLGDGARWIWDLAAEHFGERVEIVDWYHATEHVWAAARALEPEGTAVAAWAAARLQELWAQGPAPVLAALRAARPPTGEAAEVLRRELGYFSGNRARMQYPVFRARGLPCGSGAVESAAKHVVQQRLKRAGCRWSLGGADALLALRCRRATGLAAAA